MKKHLLVLALLWAYMSLMAQGEQRAVGSFAGGVRIGATTSQISGDDLSGFHKIGATAGGFVNWLLLDNPNFGLKLQLEMNFVMKGSHSFTPPKQVAVPTSKYVLNLGYVEVPLLARMRVARITIRNSSDFEFEAGPVFGVNVYQHERNSQGTILGRPDFTRFEFSMMAGIGYNFKEHHSVTLRYANSVLAVRVPTWAVNRWIKRQYNSVIFVTYAYQF